jgi:class 3 adenylate cyclase
VLATVLFTDIVGSTRLAWELGDAAWCDLLERHHAIVRAALAQHGGCELDNAGDGFFAMFALPGEAVECAAAIVERVRELGIDVRAAVHAGECTIVGGKPGGVAIAIAASILDEAEPGEVVLSSTVADLIVGSELPLHDRGTHVPKGIPRAWRLYAVGSH